MSEVRGPLTWACPRGDAAWALEPEGRDPLPRELETGQLPRCPGTGTLHPGTVIQRAPAAQSSLGQELQSLKPQPLVLRAQSPEMEA